VISGSPDFQQSGHRSLPRRDPADKIPRLGRNQIILQQSSFLKSGAGSRDESRDRACEHARAKGGAIFLMKQFLLGTAALMATSAAAQAADLPARIYAKAPVAAPVSNWTGFYLFGGGGYGLMTTDEATLIGKYFPNYPSRQGGRGWFGTVGAGYDHQFNGSWVAGIFGDAQFGDIKGGIDIHDNGHPGLTTNKTSYAIGARLGYLIAPNVLSYINGGYSHADFSGSLLTYALSGDASFQVPNRSHDGWFLGGGVENALDMFGLDAPGWFMKTEYRVAEYNRKNTNAVSFSTSLPFEVIATKPYVQTVSTSLVYRFNSHVARSAGTAPSFATKAAHGAAVSWNGFYLSGGGGYGQWTTDEHTTHNNPSFSAFPIVHSGGRGWFGTVGGGYDHQFGSWIAGIFADAQFGDIKGTFDAAPAGIGGPTTNKTSYAVGARLGYLIAPNVLSYVNGGYSHADFSGAGFQGPAEFASLSEMHLDGWFVGGGVENALDMFGLNAPGWFMKTEYRLAEYGRKTTAFNDTTLTDWRMSFKPYVQTVSTSLVYRFNWGSPVAARN